MESGTTSSPAPADPPPGKGGSSPGKTRPLRTALVLLRQTLRPAKTLLRLLASGALGGLAVLIIVVVIYLNSKADLDPWHKVDLDEEFTRKSKVGDFAAYLELEDRLFAELDQEVYDITPAGSADIINRYQDGSPADPRGRQTNWNRSFELAPAAGPVKSGVLLLHGMSDSPYSLLWLGKALQQQGAHVVGLRLPGHGTAPSGMLSFEWEDMDAAVQLGMHHLQEKVGSDQPLYIVGYSNGGALAIHHALEALDDASLPMPQGIVLISPAIGVSPMAAFAVWQGRMGRILGLEKLAWTSVGIEYDPFKYVSFSVNAGHQVHRLTVEIDRHLSRLAGTDKLESFPPVIAFQSVVDATVSAPALVEVLFDRLPGDRHELVLFDIDRSEVIDSLMSRDPAQELADVLGDPNHAFTVRLLTNRDSPSHSIEIRTWRDGKPSGAAVDTGLAWPQGIFSLSHIALPFPAHDELYGNLPRINEDGETVYRIGNVALRGERNLLRISPTDQLRLRWNPFFVYLEKRLLEFTSDNKP